MVVAYGYVVLMIRIECFSRKLYTFCKIICADQNIQSVQEENYENYYESSSIFW